MFHSHSSPRNSTPGALLTDLYQLTMAFGYWKAGMHEREAVFHLFYRKNPFKGGYAIAAGLELVIQYLQNWRFTDEDLSYLRSLKGAKDMPLFEEDFLTYLGGLQFSCDVEAIPEGTVVFPHEPLLRIKGPILQAQLIETALLNIINFSTLIATKSARMVQAAEGDSILEFGLRRAQGPDGGLTASRSAYIGGCTGTSHVLAGQRYGIPVKGTHAHSWIMGFANEREAFETYAAAMPHNCILLVDTYDTLQGVEKAIEVGLKLKKKGFDLLGVRLDSGDLAELSKASRKLLDNAGLHDALIVASNDLDEYRIRALKAAGAPIDVWGIGTKLATGGEQAALGGVYKLAAIQDEEGIWQYKIKQSEDMIKVSNPGLLQVQRWYDQAGKPMADRIIDEWQTFQSQQMISLKGEFEIELGKGKSQNLLAPIFRNGDLVYNLPSLDIIRAHCLAQQALFKQVELKLYPQGLESQLFKIKQQMLEDINQSSDGLISVPN
ncbi:MAG: nicotinate phosphoribosyltransferase [Saprospiraceae bacterium]|nr:nicotinate phosphoribosyltransferase [Saprospiraceae bacterium]